MSIRIVQMQIYYNVRKMGTFIYGLGLDGIVYTYDDENKHWTPITTKRVNPLHRQPAKKLRHQIEGGEEHV